MQALDINSTMKNAEKVDVTLSATSKLVKAWESKNAKNAAKASGLTLMALSLSACGGSDSTATTTTPTTPAADPQSLTLTAGIDTFVGGTGADTFAGTVGNTEPTITAGDSVKGGAGADIFSIISTGTAGTVAGVTIEGVETIRVSDTSTGATTVNLAGLSGFETLESFGSAHTNTVTFSNVGSITDLSLSNTSGTGAHTVAYTAATVSGASDTQNIALTTASNTGVTTVAGVETVAITASGNSSIDLVAADAATVTVAASDDTTVTLSNAANTSLETITGSGTGDVSYVVDFDLGEITATGGAGADVFDVSSGTLASTDTLDGGAGSDTMLYQSTAAAVASATIAADGATISNVEVLELEADDGANDTAFTVDMDSFEGVTSVVLDANDADAANSFTLNDANATQLGAITAQVAAGGATVVLDAKDGTGTADAAVINATMGATAGTLTVTDSNNNIESLTVNATGDNDQTIAITNGDFTGSTAADATLTVTGGGADRDMTITGNLTSDTVDFSDVLSDVTATFGATGSTVTGGVGDDTFNFGANFGSTDTIDGGAGTDTVAIAPAGSIARPGTLTNIEKLELGATGASTIVATTFSGLNELVLSNGAGLNDNVVTLQNLSGITTITHDVADAAANDGADDGNGVTITNGFTGTSDSLTLALDNAGANAGASVIGALNLAGLETLNVAVTGGADNDTATVGGITATGLNAVVVTSTGFSEDAVNIALGTVSDGSNDEMASFDASGSVTGVSVVLADMGAAASIVGSDFADNISVAGSTGDDLSIISGDGADQITLGDGTDRVTVTLGTGDADVFIGNGDTHNIAFGTGTNGVNFLSNGTDSTVITGLDNNDTVTISADDTDTAVNAHTAGSAVGIATVTADVNVFLNDATTTDAVWDGDATTSVIADFTDVADAGDVEVFLEGLLSSGTAGDDDGTSVIVLNDTENTYAYDVVMLDGEVTSLQLMATFEDVVLTHNEFAVA